MERDWVLVSKCENALNGTGLLVAELEVPANVAPLLEVAEEVLAVSAFTGVERVLADGGKRGEVVRALEPAEGEPWPVELAGAPPAPAEAVACVSRFFHIFASHITSRH